MSWFGKSDPNAPHSPAQTIARAPMVRNEKKAAARRRYCDGVHKAAEDGELSPGESDGIALDAEEIGLPIERFEADVELARVVNQLEKFTENFVSRSTRLDSEIEAAAKAVETAQESVTRARIERARLQSERNALGNSWQRLERLRRNNPRLYSDNMTDALDGRPATIN